jgi:hypothetical protein
VELPLSDRTGRTDIEGNFRAVFDAADADTNHKRSPNIHPENVRLQQFGDTIVITFEFKRSEHSTGRRTIVFNKLKGSWLIVHLHASNVTPREPVSNFAAEAPFATVSMGSRSDFQVC